MSFNTPTSIGATSRRGIPLLAAALAFALVVGVVFNACSAPTNSTASKTGGSDSNAAKTTSTPAVTSLFRWGGDAEGGAPFVEADPSDPSKARGFDVELAELMARGLNREPKFIQVTWASIEQSVERGDFEIGMSGVEDRPALRERHSVTIPYFEFYEVLAVRAADSARFHTLKDLKGHKVATLGATGAYDLLKKAEIAYGVIPVSYDDDVHPYSDLVSGRVDAVLLDNVIAERSRKREGGFVIQPTPIDTGHYVGVISKANSVMRDSANVILRENMRNGTLEKIFRSWNVWDDNQAAYEQHVLAAAGLTRVAIDTSKKVTDPTVNAVASGAPRATSSIATYIPALLRAAVITLLVSCLAMTLAVSFGAIVAAGRVYGPYWVRVLLLAYVEVVRGTPVLLQLFVLYYGLSSVIRLPALVAAILGLGLNYAAYESEIYRAALENISRSQLEAARTLGLSEMQILRLVRGPQAFRLALAPMTNDFVALLKDSSLVSVITVVELTKETAIYATNIGSWVIPGMLCASVYLLMSLPLSNVARRLERRWSSVGA
ncbi:MAG: ABC transporter substrate-binding protein/permease [Gemmatimonadaceae bacterium]